MMKILASFLLVAVFGLLGVAALPANMIPKQLAGPPSEFIVMNLFTPSEAALSGSSAFIWLEFDQAIAQLGSAPSQSILTVELPVDATETFAFAIFSPHEKDFKLQLVNPNKKTVKLNGEASSWPIGDEQVPGTAYKFTKDVVVGTWVLTITVPTGLLSQMNSDFGDGAVILFNDDSFRIKTHLSTYNLQFQKQIGLVTEVSDSFGTRLLASQGNAISARMELVLPDGTEETVEMKDDGLHADGKANDGIWGATIEAEEMGIYMAEAIVSGTDSNGVKFIRSTQHLLPVVDKEVSLTGNARAVTKDKRIVIEVEVVMGSTFNILDTLFRPYAQVWGTHVVTGAPVPVCWLSSMQAITKASGANVLRLELDTKWLQMAHAKGPLTLKNVVVQESNYYIPLSQMNVMNVKMTPEASVVLRSIQPAKIEITKEMTEGVMPEFLMNLTTNAGAPFQMLLHGYCAGGNPWKSYSSWRAPAFYDDPSANRLNQDFAEQVFKFAADQKMTAWSVIGHSQGGIVGLYLLNYYFTGMDGAKNGRLIQSVGTPWRGCSGAGTGANLAKIFGQGCGSNYDLTVDGSTLFLSGIRPDTRKEVDFYTTTYQQGKPFGDYCNLAVNFVLEWPNDGTCELIYSDFEGGVNKGNIQKWCHTTGMGYPAQYTDNSRNAVLNANSAS